MAPFSFSSLVLVCMSVAAATAQTLSNSNIPAEYFGGSDNDVYLDWADGVSRYTSSVFLPSNADPNLGAAVHWSIEGDSIFLAVAARATGWLGFGLSENGGMKGADMVLFTAENPDELVDSYILEERFPITDDFQNWSLLDSHTEGGFLIFEATRLLDTGDPQDRVIMNDALMTIPSSRIIAAWGDTPAVGYHGNNRARGAVRWFDDRDGQDLFQQTMQTAAEGSFEVRASDYPIKPMDTEYALFCASREDILAQGAPDVEKLTIVGFEPIVDDDTRAFVHHFTVNGSTNTNNGESQNCGGDFQDSFELAYVWAPGEEPLALPDNLGAPFGGLDGFQSFVIEIHYNNPDRVEGMLDSSGVRFYYTEQPREFEMGILELGDPELSLDGEPVGNGLSSHAFSCPGSCSSIALQGQPVTVIREHLHMHQSGTRIFNEQIRGGEVIRAGVVDFFDFNQQGSQPVQQEPFQVLPGDGFNTVCYYRGQDGEKFGESSQNEMCIAFVFYFPRRYLFEGIPWMCGYDIGIASCDSERTERTLSSDADLERNFGTPAMSASPVSSPTASPVSSPTAVTSNAGFVTQVSILAVVLMSSVTIFF